MNTVDLKNTLTGIFQSPERKLAVMLQGSPGVGKTAIVAEAAEAARKELVTIALPTCEAVDLRGLPQVVEGQTRWASPLPRGGEGVLLLDELSSAAPDVQVAAHHLVWTEKGSDTTLPEGWHIVLTGNRATDKTLYRAVSGPLRNRLTTINVEADSGSWTDWAMDHNLNPNIIGFIRWRPELLTVKEVPGEGAFPSPRAWNRASTLLGLSVSANVERELLVGTLGEGVTTEFAAYLRTARELPSIESILADPKHADVPSSPSLQYALVTNLAQYTRQFAKSAMVFVKRMPAEFGLRYIVDVRDHFDIREDEEIVKWVSSHKALFATK